MTSGSDVAIQLNGVGKTYAGRGAPTVALTPFDMEVSSGEFLCLLGPSGCGKTTLLRMIAGLLAPTTGTIRIHGKELWSGGRRESDVLGDLGVVFQNSNLFPWRTVLDNVTLPLQLRGVSKRERDARGRELIELVGLRGFEQSRPYELSGGMSQRVAIARALCHGPSTLLMDEPFGALDALTREQMNLEVQRIWLETSTTVVLVTHSIDEAVFLGDRVVRLSARPGRVSEITEVPFGRPRGPELHGTAEFQRMVLALRNTMSEG